MRPPSARVAQRRVRALTAVLWAASLVLLAVVDGATWSLPALVVLGGVVVLTELRPVHIGRNGQRHSFTLTEGPLVAALAIAPSRQVVLVVTAGVLVAQVARGLPRYKIAFNTAQFAVATAVATVLAQVVAGSVGVMLAVSAFMLLNDGLVRLVITLTTGRPAGRPMQDAGAVWLLHIAAVISIALLGAHMYLADARLLPAFLAPALLVLWSQEQANRRRARLTVVDTLAAQATAIYGRSSEETAVLLTRTAREVLAAGRTELVLLGDDSLVVFADGPDGVQRSRLSHTELISGWRGRVFEAVLATAEGTWAGVVVGREVPRALLSIWRDEDQESFRAQDVALLQTLADTVADWLSVPEQEDGTVLALRRRVLDFGSKGKDLADALGLLATVRHGLEATAGGPAQVALAADLRDVETLVARFVGALVIEQRLPQDGDVVTGQWLRTS